MVVSILKQCRVPGMEQAVVTADFQRPGDAASPAFLSSTGHSAQSTVKTGKKAAAPVF